MFDKCKQNWPRPRRRGIPRKCRKKLSCFWGWWCNSKLLDRSGSHFFQLPIVPAFALCSCWSVGSAPNWMLNCWLPSIAEVWVIQSSHLMSYIRQNIWRTAINLYSDQTWQLPTIHQPRPFLQLFEQHARRALVRTICQKDFSHFW